MKFCTHPAYGTSIWWTKATSLVLNTWKSEVKADSLKAVAVDTEVKLADKVFLWEMKFVVIVGFLL